jgi:hypothetical protein
VAEVGVGDDVDVDAGVGVGLGDAVVVLEAAVEATAEVSPAPSRTTTSTSSSRFARSSPLRPDTHRPPLLDAVIDRLVDIVATAPDVTPIRTPPAR